MNMKPSIRGGYDYHLPVEKSPVKEPSLYVCHIAVEMAPIAKVSLKSSFALILPTRLSLTASAQRPPRPHFLHASLPLQVGGLGDVVTALGRAVQDQGHQVECILPKFQFFNSSPILNGQIKYETEFDWGGTRCAGWGKIKALEGMDSVWRMRQHGKKSVAATHTRRARCLAGSL